MKRMSKAWLLLLFAMMLCVPSMQSVEAATVSSSIKLNKTAHVLKQGKKLTLRATIKGKKKTILWNSSNKRVATVSSKGVVSAKKNGTTLISATIKGTKKKATCKVIVGTPVTKLKVNTTKINITVGDKRTIKTSVLPTKASMKTVTYNSSNTKVASVSSKGIIIAKGVGTAKITVTAKDGSGKKTTVTVIVKKKEIKVSGITATPVAVKVGATSKVNVAVTPANATNKKVTYKSSNEKIAKVDANGNVTGVTAGTCNIVITAVDGSRKTATAKVTVSNTIVATTGVTLNKQNTTLHLGNTEKLIATVAPKNATNQGVTWASSNQAVVSVDAQGMITANGVGSASITVKTVDGGKIATCHVVVPSTAKVATQQALNKALTSKDITIIEITTSAAMTFTIPEGNYNNKTLVVTAANAEVKNSGTFKQIQVKAIAPNTWYEYGTNNIFMVTAQEGRIVLSATSTAAVTVEKGSSSLAIENNGQLTLNVDTASVITIDGASKVAPKVQVSAANATVDSTQSLQVTAKNKFELVLRPGAEHTEVTVNTATSIPSVKGLGQVPVTITDTNEFEIVVAEDGKLEHLSKVTVEGKVVDSKNQALEGVELYLLPYNPKITQESYLKHLNGAITRVSSGANGAYVMNQVELGNYMIVTIKEGYKATVQVLSLTSNDGTTITNETISLLDVSQTEVGHVVGQVINAKTGKAVENGITVRIRKGHNNLSGTALKEELTKTNTGAYEFHQLEPGYYTLQVVDRRNGDLTGGKYTSTSINIQILSNETVEHTISVSSLEEAGQVRIVLTWGDKNSGAPSDLDSHLTGPKATGIGRFHTFFADRSYYETFHKLRFDEEDMEYSRTLYADLDLDDTDYEGPETTTIYQSIPGNYSYYVHDFSNQTNPENIKLGDSSAKVEVYVGNSLRATYHVPNQRGTLWHVFDYDSATGTIQTVNNVDYHDGSAGDVGTDPIELARERLEYTVVIAEEVKSNQVNTQNSAWIQAEIEKANVVLASSRNLEELQTANTKLYEFLDTIRKDIGIEGVEADSLTSYEYYSDYTYGELYLYQRNRELSNLTINGKVLDVTNMGQQQYRATIVGQQGYSAPLYIYIRQDFSGLQINQVSAAGLTYYEVDQDNNGVRIDIYSEYNTLEDVVINGAEVTLQVVEDETNHYTTMLRGEDGTEYLVSIYFRQDLSSFESMVVSAKNMTDYNLWIATDENGSEYLNVIISARTNTLKDLIIGGTSYEVIFDEETNYGWITIENEKGISCRAKVRFSTDYEYEIEAVAGSNLNGSFEWDYGDSGISLTVFSKDETIQDLKINGMDCIIERAEEGSVYYGFTNIYVAEDYTVPVFIQLKPDLSEFKIKSVQANGMTDYRVWENTRGFELYVYAEQDTLENLRINGEAVALIPPSEEEDEYYEESYRGTVYLKNESGLQCPVKVYFKRDYSSFTIDSVTADQLTRYNWYTTNRGIALTIYAKIGTTELTNLTINGKAVELQPDSNDGYYGVTSLTNSKGDTCTVYVSLANDYGGFQIASVVANGLTRYETSVGNSGIYLEIYSKEDRLEEISINGQPVVFTELEEWNNEYHAMVMDEEGQEYPVYITFRKEYKEFYVSSLSAKNLVRYDWWAYSDTIELNIWATSNELEEVVLNGTLLTLEKDPDNWYYATADYTNEEGNTCKVYINFTKDFSQFTIQDVSAKNYTKHEVLHYDDYIELKVYAENETLEEFVLNGKAINVDELEWYGYYEVTMEDEHGFLCPVRIRFIQDSSYLTEADIHAKNMTEVELYRNQNGLEIMIYAENDSLEEFTIKGETIELVEEWENQYVGRITNDNGFTFPIRVRFYKDLSAFEIHEVSANSLVEYTVWNGNTYKEIAVFLEATKLEDFRINGQEVELTKQEEGYYTTVLTSESGYSCEVRVYQYMDTTGVDFTNITADHLSESWYTVYGNYVQLMVSTYGTGLNNLSIDGQIVELLPVEGESYYLTSITKENGFVIPVRVYHDIDFSEIAYSEITAKNIISYDSWMSGDDYRIDIRAKHDTLEEVTVAGYPVELRWDEELAYYVGTVITESGAQYPVRISYGIAYEQVDIQSVSAYKMMTFNAESYQGSIQLYIEGARPSLQEVVVNGQDIELMKESQWNYTGTYTICEGFTCPIYISYSWSEGFDIDTVNADALVSYEVAGLQNVEIGVWEAELVATVAVDTLSNLTINGVDVEVTPYEEGDPYYGYASIYLPKDEVTLEVKIRLLTTANAGEGVEPSVNAESETTEEPEVTVEPEVTEEPEVTVEPEVTEEPGEVVEEDVIEGSLQQEGEVAVVTDSL